MAEEEEDIFEAALNIEDTSYAQGYAEGHADGSRAGTLEGRAFGLQKGFEKFFEVGKLHGRAVVWGARHPAPATAGRDIGRDDVQAAGERDQGAGSSSTDAAKLTANADARLEKHLRTFFALTEPDQMTTVNEEVAVADVDDRLKRAVAKIKVLERIVGEQHVRLDADHGIAQGSGGATKVTTAGAERNIEDFTTGPNIRTGA